MDFSFIIPSNRPPIYHLDKVIDSINSARDAHRFSYEIVVCHTDEVKGQNVRNVRDCRGAGPIWAFNTLALEAKGDCIISSSDAVRICCDFAYWAGILNGPFKDRKIQVGGTGHDQTPMIVPEAGVSAEIIRFPFFTPKCLREYFNGYLFHPAFTYHYSDSWIGAWTKLMGEPAREYGYFNCFTNIWHDNVDRYDDVDLKVLLRLCKNFKNNPSYTAV